MDNMIGMRTAGLVFVTVIFCFSANLASAQNANVWVDVNGGNCSRNASAGPYVDGAACSSFSAAYSAAGPGDTVRIKAGTYGPQSAGGAKIPPPQFLGESGVVINTGSSHGVTALSLSGNVIVDNVNVGGDAPTVGFFSGSGSTWQNSTFLASTGLRRCGDNEPILIYGDLATVSNVTLRKIVIQQQKADPNGCPAPDTNYHLEMIRIDKAVNGVLIDQVTFGICPDGAGFTGCGSGQVFITTPSTSTPDPVNLTIQNSIFLPAINYHIQTHDNWTANNFTLAYNTFTAQEPILISAGGYTNSRFIGNTGTRPQTCTGGITYTKNLWQWSSGAACGTDRLVIGNAYAIDRLKLDSNYMPISGSPVIDAAESAGYCTGTLGSVDHAGNTRPVGSACDAGAYEYGSTKSSAPQPPTILTAAVR